MLKWRVVANDLEKPPGSMELRESFYIFQMLSGFNSCFLKIREYQESAPSKQI